MSVIKFTFFKIPPKSMNSFPLFTRFSGRDNGGHINSQKDILFLVLGL